MTIEQAYSVLQISQNANEEEIKAAYKVLAQKYHQDNYQAGPLRDEAEEKMTEINLAFDTLMSYIRTGQTAPDQGSTSSSNANRYPEVRALINSGRIDEALRELGAIPAGTNDAEWNFLMGSAYYYKGWLDQAVFYFQKAVELEPTNKEYHAALQNLRQSSRGNMQGNPFGGAPDPGGTAVNCACNTCATMCCIDMCCTGCRGF